MQQAPPVVAAGPGADAAAAAAGRASLTDLGADLLQRVLEKAPDLSAAAAAAPQIRAAVTEAFLVSWFMIWHERLAPDRPWQYAVVAAWPAARMGGARIPAPAVAAEGIRRLAGFLRAVLLRRQEAGLLDQSGPGSTPHEAAAAAARVQQLLEEHDEAERRRREELSARSCHGKAGEKQQHQGAAVHAHKEDGIDADEKTSGETGQAGGGAGAAAAGDGGGGGVLGGQQPAVQALLLLCPHAEHLLAPYLAQGGHAGALALVLKALGCEAPNMLPWLAAGVPAPVHDLMLSACLGAMRGGHAAAVDVVLDAARQQQRQQQQQQQQQQQLPGIVLEVAVEYSTPEFIRGSRALREEWQAQTVPALLVHLGSAAARKDDGAAAMTAFVLGSLADLPGGAGAVTAGAVDRVIGGMGSATPEMADLAMTLAAQHGRLRSLLRHAVGSPALARLLLPRLAAAALSLFSPPAKIANEISHVLVESADSEGSLEVATLLWDLEPEGSPGRRELSVLLAARRPASLMEWHWLHSTLGGGAGEQQQQQGGQPCSAEPLQISHAYWGVLQAALEYSYGVAAAKAAAAALDAGLVAGEGAGITKEEISEAKIQARMLEAVRAGDLRALRQLEEEQREARRRAERRRAARRQRRLEQHPEQPPPRQHPPPPPHHPDYPEEAAHEARRRQLEADEAPQALPFGARGLLLAAAEAGHLGVLSHLLDRLHSARQLQPRDPIHVEILNRALARGHLAIVELLMGPLYGVATAAVSREPLLPTPLLRAASRRALPPDVAARAAAILLEHSRDNPLLLSRWLSTYNAQLPETASHVTRIVRSALSRADEDGMPSLPPGARAAEVEAVAEAAVIHGVHSLDRLAAVLDWLCRAGRITRPRRGARAAAAGGEAGGSDGGDEGDDDDEEDDSGMGFDSGEDWMDDEEEWSGDEQEREEDHLVSSSTDDDDDSSGDGDD